MLAARTVGILNISEGESAVVRRTVEALGLNERPGRGSTRVFDFAEALAIVVSIELSRKLNHRSARDVAADLTVKLSKDDFFGDPVAVINGDGTVCWTGESNIDDDFLEACRQADPLVTLYRLPTERVRNIFEQVPA